MIGYLSITHHATHTLKTETCHVISKHASRNVAAFAAMRHHAET
jgi:hypothetical protein